MVRHSALTSCMASIDANIITSSRLTTCEGRRTADLFASERTDCAYYRLKGRSLVMTASFIFLLDLCYGELAVHAFCDELDLRTLV